MATSKDTRAKAASTKEPTKMVTDLDVHDILQELSNVTPCLELNKFFGDMIALYEQQTKNFMQHIKHFFDQTIELVNQEKEILKLGEKQKRLQASLKLMQEAALEEKKRAEDYKYKYEAHRIACSMRNKEVLRAMNTLMRDAKDAKLRNQVRLIIEPVSNLSIYMTRDTEQEEQTQVKQVADAMSMNSCRELRLKELELENERLRAINENKDFELRVTRHEREVVIEEMESKSKDDREKISSLLKRLEKAELEVAEITNMMLHEQIYLKRDRAFYYVKTSMLHRCVQDLIQNASLSTGDGDLLRKIYQVTEVSSELEQLVDFENPSQLIDQLYQFLKDYDVVSEVHPTTGAMPQEAAAHTREISVQVQEPQEARKMLLKQSSARKAFYEAYLKSKEELEFERQHRDAYIEPFKKQNEKLIEHLKTERNRNRRLFQHEYLKNEGLKTEISSINKNMQKIKKTIVKDLILRKRREPHEDMLKAIHKSTRHKTEAARQIHHLKRKLHDVENNMMQI